MDEDEHINIPLHNRRDDFIQMSRSLKQLAIALLVATLPAILTTAATGAEESKKSSSLSAFPDQVVLTGREARQQLLVTGMDGERSADATWTATYATGDPEIATVTEQGVVLPAGTGETEIVVTLGDQTISVPVRIEQGDEWLPLDFRHDINPIFTKRGCNGGGCHGKTSGQGGFRLSLFGFVPEMDFEQTTNGSRGRRIFTSAPERSLLLQKPTMALPHGGGARLTVGEPEYDLLVRWIAEGTPKGASDRELTGVELHPDSRALPPGTTQQLLAMAHYSDGTRRDVTRLVQYETNDPSIADVDEWGQVTVAQRTGETSIVAVFQGHAAVSRIMVPLDSPSAEPSIAMPVRNFIDEHVQAKLQELGVPPSEESDEATFLRRATLQIAGRIPTAEEVREFLADSGSEKHERLIDRLLASGDYADHFAQKWADILRNKRRGQKDRLPGTIAFHRWIRNALAKNVPYDQFVREIITATGDVSVTPTAQWYAEVRYLDAFVDDSAQVFLGLRIGCARCHHHPSEKITQRDYYGLAAFFGRVDRKGGSGVAERRANEAIFVKPAGSVKHPETGEVVPPHGLGGPELEIPPYEDPRHAYVDWMAEPENPYFARAFVNRMWGHFFGRGLVDPLDDMRVTNPASNEALLEALAEEFIRSGFDMKHIVRTICTSTTYRLSSDAHEHNLDEIQNHSRFYPQRLTAEVLHDALDAATGRPTGFGGLPSGTRAVQLPDEGYSNSFLKLFGRPLRETACECERTAEPSLSQTLFVMNDSFVLNKVSDKNSLAGKLAADEREPEERISDLFVSTLSREPRAEEVERAVAYLAGEEDPHQAWSNLLWALVNTKEFMFVH